VTTLVEKILAIHESLTDGGVEHAFGGALALAFHVQEPRATRDVDVNVFCPPSEARTAFEALPGDVRTASRDLRAVERDGQVRLFWDDTPVDVFFSTAELHAVAAQHRAWVPFAGTTIPVLGATELMIFKAFFDRTKDWADLEAMVAVGSADGHRALGWLVALLGGEDHRIARLRDVLQS
jgi:hypothetical protein